MQLLAPAIEFVATALSTLIGWIAKAIDFFVQLITGSKTASAQFTAAFNGVGEFFGNLIGGVVKIFTGLPGLIGSALAGLGGLLTDIGRNMIQGLINGASSLLGSLSSFVSNLVSRYIVGPVKSLLGIRSPSRVFAEIGGYTMAGLEIGLSDTSGVRSAVDSLGKELASTTLPAPASVPSPFARRRSTRRTPPRPPPSSRRCPRLTAPASLSCSTSSPDPSPSPTASSLTQRAPPTSVSSRQARASS